MTSAAELSVTLRRFQGRSGSLLGGEYNTVPLVRRQSEPQVCTLSAHSDVRNKNSWRGSASSVDGWSEGNSNLSSSVLPMDLCRSMVLPVPSLVSLVVSVDVKHHVYLL